MGGEHEQNLKIYYFSGTGNSRHLALQMSKLAAMRKINAQAISMDDGIALAEMPGRRAGLLGLIFPTHGFTAPWHVLKFVLRLPVGKGAPVFCATTRAALKFGRFILPGVSGSAPFIIAFLLWLKQYKVRGCFSVDMPSNWFSLHPIQRRTSHEHIIQRAEAKTKRFMTILLDNKKVWLTANNLYEIIWGVLLFPVSAAYLFMGRFFLAKLFFANENCDGCKICEQNCPVRAIKMWGRSKTAPYWKYSCESCMRCAAICPQEAIEAGHSWGLILYFITALPVSFYLLKYLAAYFPFIEKMNGRWLYFALDLLFFYPAVFISYFIFRLLLEIPAVNRLFALTTFTHLPFWGRYRAPGGLPLRNHSETQK